MLQEASKVKGLGAIERTETGQFRKGTPRSPHAGRKKGQPNKVSFDLKAALAKHGPELRKALLKLCRSDNETVRLAAIKEAMDRLYGKARQPIGGDEPGQPLEVIHRVVVEDQPIPLGPVVDVEATPVESSNGKGKGGAGGAP